MNRDYINYFAKESRKLNEEKENERTRIKLETKKCELKLSNKQREILRGFFFARSFYSVPSFNSVLMRDITQCRNCIFLY